MRLPAAFVLVLTSALVGSSATAVGSSAEIERRVTLEAAVVRELNRVRADRGIGPVRVAPALRTAARGHTRAMLTHGFFSHDSLDGTSFSDRIRRHYGTRGWSTWSVGETIMASRGGEVGARAIVASWLGSPPHRRIVLMRTWRDVGVGALSTRAAPPVFGGDAAVVVTADFGLRKGRAELP